MRYIPVNRISVIGADRQVKIGGHGANIFIPMTYSDLKICIVIIEDGDSNHRDLSQSEHMTCNSRAKLRISGTFNIYESNLDDSEILYKLNGTYSVYIGGSVICFKKEVPRY